MKYADHVTILNAPHVEDGYNGGQRPDWPNATATRVPAAVQWQSTREDVEGRQTTISRATINTPPDAPLKATSRVQWDGLTFEVDGEAALHKRRGRPHHLEGVLRVVNES